MTCNKKNTNPIDDQLLAYYLQELSKIKLMNHNRLKNLHKKIHTHKYSNQKAIQKLSSKLLENN